MSVISAIKGLVTGKNTGPIKDPKPNSPEAKKAAGLIELEVWHTPPINRALLIAFVPETDPTNPMNLVNVQVRDNGHFIKKMRLHARKVADKRYILEGPLPRWRGRW